MALTYNYRNTIVDSLTGRRGSSSGLGIYSAYIGLSSSEPKPDGSNITEPRTDENGDDTGYGRVLIGTNNQSDTYLFPTAEKGVTTNNKHIYFPEAVKPWGRLTHFVLFTAATGGTPIAYAELREQDTEEGEQGQPAPINVDTANTIVLFRPGTLTIKYTDVL